MTGSQARWSGFGDRPGHARDSGDPFRQRGPSDMERRGDVGDRAANLDHLGDRSLSSEHGKRAITAGHGTGLFLRDGRLQHHPSCRPGTRSFILTP